MAAAKKERERRAELLRTDEASLKSHAQTKQGLDYAKLFRVGTTSKERGKQLVKEDQANSKKDGKKKKKKFGM